MAITLNADTSSGLVMTSDTSGNINIQSGGTTVCSITSSGLNAAGLTGTLPAIDGSSLTNLPAPAALSTATSSTSQPSYSVRAWIRWDGNGTGAGAIVNSGGVSSYTRAGTGDYDIFWSVTLDDSAYAVTVCSSEARWDRGLSANGFATNKATMVYEDTSGTRVDGGNLMLMMIR